MEITDLDGLYRRASSRYAYSEFLEQPAAPLTPLDRVRWLRLTISAMRQLHDGLVRERAFALAAETRKAIGGWLEEMHGLLKRITPPATTA